jgi:hypothetical protein
LIGNFAEGFLVSERWEDALAAEIKERHKNAAVRVRGEAVRNSADDVFVFMASRPARRNEGATMRLDVFGGD